MRLLVVLLGCLPAIAAQAPPPAHAPWLEHLVAAAETFEFEAPRYVGVEHLKQQAVVWRKRFAKRPETAVQTREIVSEYGFASFKDAPGVLRELRKPVSVDDRPVTTQAKARETLVEGIVSRDERARRQILRDFEALGLEGAIADFGPSLALFRRDRIGDYAFEPAGSARLGPDSVMRVRFRQTPGHESLTIFERKRAIHVPLAGEIWLREGDFLPVRISFESERRGEDRGEIRDQTVVDYQLAARGVLLPASVVHRQWENGQLLLEDVLSYSQFQRFSSETEIRFEEK